MNQPNAENSVNFELVREHADTIIMNILLEKDRYGYEIIDILDEKSKGKYSIKQPTLYNALKRLEKLGFISSYFGDESNGGRRKYYTLTEKGRKVLDKDQREWEFSRTVLDNLLSDKQIDLKDVEAPFELNELKPATKRIKIYDDKYEEREEQPKSIVIPITLEAKVGNGAPFEIKTTLVNEKFEQIDMLNESSASVKPAIDPEAIARAEELRLSQKRLEELKQAENKEKEEKKEKAAKILFSEFEPVSIIPIEKVIKAPVFDVNTDIFEANPKYNEALATEAPVFLKNETFREKPFSYKDAFSGMFTKPAQNQADLKNFEPKSIASQMPKAKHFNDLKQELLGEEDIKLRMYSKANTANYYHMRYIFSNKLLKDTSLLVFLAVIVQLLIFFIAKNVFGVTLKAVIILAALASIIPVFGVVNYLTFKEKRSKANFNIKNSFLSSLIIFVITASFFTCLTLIIPSLEINFATGRLYTAYILMMNIPISVIIYGVLFKSNNYHIKN